MLRLCLLPLGFLITSVAAGQSAVEYTVGAGASSGAAGAMRGAGKSAARILQRAAETAEPGSTSISTIQNIPTKSEKPRSEPSVQGQTEPPAKTYEDPAAITAGMSLDEVARRFGEAAIKTTEPDGSRKLWYEGRNAQVLVTVADGKVSAVSSKTRKRETSGIVVLQ